MAPLPGTVARFVGAAGGNVSRGVTQIGSVGSLSIVAVPTVATLRTTKHCSLPATAPACTKICSSSGLVLSGTGARTGTPAGGEPAAGTGYTLYWTPGASSDADAGGSHVTVTDVSSHAVFPERAGPGAASNGTSRRTDGVPAWRCDCLLYTSDAADDLLCVDLGGR